MKCLVLTLIRIYLRTKVFINKMPVCVHTQLIGWFGFESKFCRIDLLWVMSCTLLTCGGLRGAPERT